MDAWNTIVSFWGRAYFQVRTVSFTEGIQNYKYVYRYYIQTYTYIYVSIYSSWYEYHLFSCVNYPTNFPQILNLWSFFKDIYLPGGKWSCLTSSPWSLDWLCIIPTDSWEEMGVSLNGGTPISHPKMIIFSRKTHGCWGNPPFQETPKWVPVLLVENQQSFLCISTTTKITLFRFKKIWELSGKIPTWHVHPMEFHN